MAGCIRIPLGTEVGLSPGDTVLDGALFPPPQKKVYSPNFQPMFIVAKRSPISATAELLLKLAVSVHKLSPIVSFVIYIRLTMLQLTD